MARKSAVVGAIALIALTVIVAESANAAAGLRGASHGALDQP